MFLEKCKTRGGDEREIGQIEKGRNAEEERIAEKIRLKEVKSLENWRNTGYKLTATVTVLREYINTMTTTFEYITV